MRRLLFVARMLFGSYQQWPLSKWVGFWFGSVQKITLNGYRICVRSRRISTKIADLAMAWEVFNDNVYDYYAIREDDVVVDVGGHIGSFTIKAAINCAKGKVFTFEPTPETFETLKENVKDLKNVHVFNAAVSDFTGTQQLYLADDNPAENSLFRKTDKHIDVELITMHDFFLIHQISRVNLLKIDCEGAEYNIVTNSIEELKNKVEKIVMEVHEPKYFGIPSRHSIQSLIHILESANFRVKYQPENRFQGYIYAKNRCFGSP
jgi:FkbM family methyltransferase